MEFKNISRKELAVLANFSYSSFTNGIKRGSIPAADVALRIAKALGTTVEALFDEKESVPISDKATLQFVKTYLSLSERDRELLGIMASSMAKMKAAL